MKSSRLIIIGVFFVFIFFVVVYYSSGQKDNTYKVDQDNTNTTPITPESLVGDSTADSYAALQATVQKSINTTKDALKENERLKAKIASLESQSEKTLKILQNKTTQTPKEVKKEPKSFLEKKTHPTETAKVDFKPTFENKKQTTTPPPFEMKGEYSLENGLGLASNLFKIPNSKTNNVSSKTYDKNDPNKGWVMPVEIEYKKAPGLQKKSVSNVTKKIEKPDPAMTISDNAILYNSVALTYLIGRIPVDGVVPDPYPVKFITGNDNLLANGYDLPGVEGMFFSGYATGDMNLNCVKATLNSYTFIFSDGRQVTYREKSGNGSGEDMAYITDRYGLPCIMGSFVSNVAEFLGIQASLTGIASAGEAYAAAQTSTYSSTSANSVLSVIDGDVGKNVLGNAVSDMFTSSADWLAARQENSFDAVVAPSGSPVSIHLNRNILIDYDKAARKVNYEYQVKSNSNLD
ncbi:TIGR03752 family integrating conjugative element protein [Psychromonas sp. B3M02]|uniref:TIGR03752 family integrating conjugative element protein n=1 Tax=Psychromonas sp. B3M02 TaxID=2267226 RepID=UPI000DEBCA95|nr:TIGR03752 family integrating conjugative element protein [Psychromonas sp. B3M02]RBW47271.1 TIGR03752 family integrating conjugative element protein [Psychromonas sp. B3M02]